MTSQNVVPLRSVPAVKHQRIHLVGDAIEPQDNLPTNLHFRHGSLRLFHLYHNLEKGPAGDVDILTRSGVESKDLKAKENKYGAECRATSLCLRRHRRPKDPPFRLLLYRKLGYRICGLQTLITIYNYPYPIKSEYRGIPTRCQVSTVVVLILDLGSRSHSWRGIACMLSIKHLSPRL